MNSRCTIQNLFFWGAGGDVLLTIMKVNNLTFVLLALVLACQVEDLQGRGPLFFWVGGGG